MLLENFEKFLAGVESWGGGKVAVNNFRQVILAGPSVADGKVGAVVEGEY